jgi:phosphoribosylformimino-5-aminoimidazole carboxamide ribonucleotide (ProFAR) isomerase
VDLKAAGTESEDEEMETQRYLEILIANAQAPKRVKHYVDLMKSFSNEFVEGSVGGFVRRRGVVRWTVSAGLKRIIIFAKTHQTQNFVTLFLESDFGSQFRK